ncbi:MAG: hypothetical protein P8X67_17510, partial [Syntrophobacterales bacterium]
CGFSREGDFRATFVSLDLFLLMSDFFGSSWILKNSAKERTAMESTVMINPRLKRFFLFFWIYFFTLTPHWAQ